MAIEFGLTEVIVFCAFAAFLVLIKCCLLNCCMMSRRYDRRTLFTLLDASRTNSAEVGQRPMAHTMNEPPPQFEYAIKNSTPISYIQTDEPPPSYEEYLKTLNTQTKIIPVHQQHTIISMR